MINAQYWQELENRVISWIRQAGDRLRDTLSDPVDVRTKTAHNDLVTNRDKEIEKFLTGKIRETYPGQNIISEEGYGDSPTDLKGVVWFVDPIDGTLNYVMQKRFFAISIAVYEDGRGRAAFVYDVMADELFHCICGSGAYRNDQRLPRLKNVAIDDALIDLSMTWIKPNRLIDENVLTEIIRKCSGTRAYGAASIELAYVAAGLIDGYFTMRLSPWDYAAGLILVNEVGGKTSRADGKPVNLKCRTSILAAGPALHEAIVRHIQKQMDSGKYMKEPPQLS
jgi:Archaeal fructose-1,6-bisphosphatase and related enzymes of inositol monophosphatase family